MKNKKNYYISITIISVMFFVNTSHVYALKQAIFPSNQSLQPIPKDAYPNISGNINSSVEAIPEKIDSPTEENVIPNTTVNKNQSDEISDKNFSPYILWSLLGLLALTIIFTIYYKKRRVE